jgi:hypothetical protein
MNGRVYDYNLGRFLSVDPFIQDPGNSQSMNPYSYIMNNPLSGTDPSGYTSVTGSRIDRGNFKEEDIMGSQITTSSGAVSFSGTVSGGNGSDGGGTGGSSDAGGSGGAGGDTADIGSQGKVAQQKPVSDVEDGTITEQSQVDNEVLFNGGMIVNGHIVYNVTEGKWELNITARVFDNGTGKGEDFIKAVNSEWSGTSTTVGGKELSINVNLTLTKNHNKASLVLNVCDDCGRRTNKKGDIIETAGSANRGGRDINLIRSASKGTYLHEFGHAMGSGHQLDSSNSIMSYSTERKVLDSDRERLVKWYYGYYLNKKNEE